MNEITYLKLQALRTCVMRPGSYEKRFVRDMSTQPRDAELTDKQVHLIDVLYWRYRGQINLVRNGSKRSAGYPEPTKPVGADMPINAEDRSSVKRAQQQQKLDRAAEKAQQKLDKWNRSVKGQR